jgi:hypothetical protein
MAHRTRAAAAAVSGRLQAAGGGLALDNLAIDITADEVPALDDIADALAGLAELATAR